MQFHPKDLSELDDLTEEHLGFSALSDGLGFSKGAKKAAQKSAQDPFGPESFDASPGRDAELKRKALSGTGAVAAGPARPAPSITGRPGVAKSGAMPGTRPASNILAEPAAPRSLRVLAFALDLVFLSLPLALGWWLSFRGESGVIFRQDPRPPLSLFALILTAYFLLSESFGGQSLGKMLLGLRVVEDDKYQKPTGLKHAALRLVLFVAGTACFGLGLLASFWDAKRRPWHDRYSGSIVRRQS